MLLLTARNVTSGGKDGPNEPSVPVGFIRYAGHRDGASLVRYHFAHDLELRDINPRIKDTSDTIVFNMWCRTGCEHMTWRNILLDGYDGYGWRGSINQGVGDWLVENVTAINTARTPEPGSSTGGTFFRPWGSALSLDGNVILRLSNPRQFLLDTTPHQAASVASVQRSDARSQRHRGVPVVGRGGSGSGGDAVPTGPGGRLVETLQSL